MRRHTVQRVILYAFLAFSMISLWVGSSKQKGWTGVGFDPREANGTTLMIAGLYYLGLAILLALLQNKPTERYWHDQDQYEQDEETLRRELEEKPHPLGFSAPSINS